MSKVWTVEMWVGIVFLITEMLWDDRNSLRISPFGFSLSQNHDLDLQFRSPVKIDFFNLPKMRKNSLFGRVSDGGRYQVMKWMGEELFI